MKVPYRETVHWSLSLIIVITSVVLCHQIISHSISNQKNKYDYAELNNVKYGLFSIDEWKRQTTAILDEEIDQLDLSGSNEQAFRKHIEVLLNTLIDKVYKKIKEGNSGSVGGQVKESFINVFISLEDIKKGIPEYTDAVIHELKKPKTRRQIKTMLNEQLEKYSNQTFASQDISQISRILLQFDSQDIEGAKSKLNKEISVEHDLIVKEALLLILLSVILFALSGFRQQPLVPFRYILLVLSLIILLIAGVTTPMIDLEAEIAQMSFMFMGHPIHFESQILYFQSKSILDVFWIMVTHKDLQVKFIGVLLITFSIVFPLVKIASSLGYYYNYRRARENRMIKFFVFGSGKWSMADVMVVAIFMAYIGFNGIIASQLDQLRLAGQEMAILTTNGTSLQPGYHLFLTYTLLALFFSGFLTRKPQSIGEEA